MRYSAALILSCLLVLGACSRAPESYPPPLQRNPLPDDSAALSGTMIQMNDANAESFFVKDISPSVEGGLWRWTYTRPELKIYLKSTRELSLVWELGIAGATFQSTGPVTVSFFVNGKPAGSLPCPKPGDYRFQKPVPAELLQANAYNTISAQVDKLWTSPADGVKLGFTLTRAGFTE